MLYAGGSLLVALTVLIGVDIVCRYVLASPIFGVQDLLKAALTGLIGLALADTWISGSNVSMNILYDRFPPSLRRGIDILTGVLGLVLALSLAYGAGEATLQNLQLRSSSPLLRLPNALLSGLMCVAAAFLAAAVVHRLVWPTGGEEPAAEHVAPAEATT
jgi:TRAP-type C4-dicarboxylate transport system permease small subunit